MTATTTMAHGGRPTLSDIVTIPANRVRLAVSEREQRMDIHVCPRI